MKGKRNLMNLNLIKPALLLLIFVSAFNSTAQKKKVIYLDTLGNEISFIELLSTINTARFKMFWDESDEKIRYIKPIPTSRTEYDSLLTATSNRITLDEKIGEKFNYPDLVDIDGTAYRTDDLKGKVVVINFWFVGCGPCEVEMPELNDLFRKYRDQEDVVFISLAKSREGKVRKFLERNEFNYPVIIMNDELASEFKISAYPTNYVIDKDGHFFFASRGIGAGAVQILENKIETLINQN